MIKKIHVKKGDKVMVISGKDKNKKGKVLVVNPKTGKVIVEGVNIATKHTKARRQGEAGGIIKQETPIYASKVMYVCDKCGKKMPHEHIDVNGDTNCDRCGINVSDEYNGGTENMTPDGWS